MSFSLEKDGFKVIRGFIDPEYIEILQTYFDLKYRVIKEDADLRKSVSSWRDKGDAVDSLMLYADTLTETTSLLYGESLSQELNMNLSPTYNFLRIYEKGCILDPHIDRPACELSVTCPITISDEKASTIYVSNYRVDYLTEPRRRTLEEVKRRGDYTRVDLLPGDIMVYGGYDRYHWRETLESDYLIQFFMHFVQTDGQFADRVFDGRPYLGFPKKFAKDK
jgi:hypothetical protein